MLNWNNFQMWKGEEEYRKGLQEFVNYIDSNNGQSTVSCISELVYRISIIEAQLAQIIPIVNMVNPIKVEESPKEAPKEETSGEPEKE